MGELINILIKQTSGQSAKVHSFNVPENSNILSVKRKLFDKINTNVNSTFNATVFELQYQGEMLIDDKTLIDYDISDGDTIMSVVKVVGGLHFYQ